MATLAHILPTCLAMVGLFAAVNVLSHSAIVAGMIGAVTPVIAVMLGIMAYEFGQKALKGFGWVTGILFLSSLLSACKRYRSIPALSLSFS